MPIPNCWGVIMWDKISVGGDSDYYWGVIVWDQISHKFTSFLYATQNVTKISLVNLL
jgi:hypothetical protein